MFKIKLKNNVKATVFQRDHAKDFVGTHLGGQKETREQMSLVEKVNKAKILPTKLVN